MAMKGYSMFPRTQLTEALPLDDLMSYLGPTLGWGSAEMHSVYYIDPANWVIGFKKINQKLIFYSEFSL